MPLCHVCGVRVAWSKREFSPLAERTVLVTSICTRRNHQSIEEVRFSESWFINRDLSSDPLDWAFTGRYDGVERRLTDAEVTNILRCLNTGGKIDNLRISVLNTYLTEDFIFDQLEESARPRNRPGRFGSPAVSTTGRALSYPPQERVNIDGRRIADLELTVLRRLLDPMLSQALEPEEAGRPPEPVREQEREAPSFGRIVELDDD